MASPQYYGNDENEFSTQQGFVSYDEIDLWVKKKGCELGYVIVTKRSKVNKKGVVRKVILACDRSGVYKGTSSTKNTASKKINCPFELVCYHDHPDRLWKLRVVCETHNHRHADTMEGHPYAMRFSDKERELVAELSRAHVRPRDILRTVKSQNADNASSLITVYNERQKAKKALEGGLSPMQVLLKILQDNGFIFEVNVNTETNELEDLFFCHPTSLAIWHSFPQVLLLDATYKTNRYNMPLLQMVGVTSTNTTFSIAFVFMHLEKEANYTWALNQLKLVMNGSYFPLVIVTDRELALMNSCDRVFPKANRFLCRWHIWQSILKHCRNQLSMQCWGNFQHIWEKLMSSSTVAIYEENYERLQQLLVNHQRVIDYVNRTWLNPYKHMFVSAWCDNQLNYNNNTTNRVESQHAHLKKLLNSTQCTLHTIVIAIEKTIDIQHTTIKTKLENSKIKLAHRLKIPYFQFLIGFVSTYALECIYKELERSKSITNLTFKNCGCLLRRSCGLPCAHELQEYVNAGWIIPLGAIDIFWRTLDLASVSQNIGTEAGCDDHIQMFRDRFAQQSEAGKTSWLRKLRDIYDPSKTMVGEPSVHKNTRGRPSFKSTNTKKTIPPQFVPTQESHRPAFFDLNDLPATGDWQAQNDAFYDEPIMQTVYSDWQPNQCDEYFNQEATIKEPGTSMDYAYFDQEPLYTDPLVYKIPDFFRPYVTKINDVRGDGNCGFRAIAVALGRIQDEWQDIRRELLDELASHWENYKRVFGEDIISLRHSLEFFGKGPAQFEHWMQMPYTAFLIAEKYKYVVNLLSISGSSTCFPLFTNPETWQGYPEMTIAHVDGNHFVNVQMQEGHPMAATNFLWFHFKDHCAAE